MPPPHRPGDGAAPHRRDVLRVGTGVLATALTGLLSGCGVRVVTGPETTPTARRGPDDDVRDGVVADAEDLLVRAAAGAAAQPALAAVVEACTAHLRALGAATAGATGAATGGAGEEPTSAVGDPQAVVDELAAAAGRALAAAQPAGGPMARLVVAVAASRAVLLDGLAAAAALAVPPIARPAGATATPTHSPAAGAGAGTREGPVTAALQRALAGEHAAVFAYGLVVGRAGEQRRAEAYADLDAHRVARDDLTDVLSARGAAPRAAQAGYDAAAATPQAAALLAATVEDHLAGAYGDVVAATPADGSTLRASAADGVVRAARAARRWGSATTSFPGVAELGEDGEPLATSSPSGVPTSLPTGTPTGT